MDNERFRLVLQFFEQLIELPPVERKIEVDRISANDPEVAFELRNLLAAHDRGKTRDSGTVKPTPQNPAMDKNSGPVKTTRDSPAQEKDSGPIKPPPHRPPMDEHRIGPYRILKRLGGGGMGDVFLGMRDDGAFRKRVAVKLIRRELVSLAEVRERFAAERQVLASLEHPNVAHIMDAGNTADGSPYLVMEYIDGEPLDSYCDRRKLAIDDRLRLFQDVCAAVHYLHSHHVVHRDIKPTNILVTAEGAPKLLDFGIAKILGPAAPEITGVCGSPMTPDYASPEQAFGRTVTPVSDIYSLGVVLYLVLTGKLPDRINLLPPSAVISNPSDRIAESSTQHHRKLSGDLDKVVLKALENDPADRYRTAGELADDLGRYLDNRTVLAGRASRMERVAKFVRRNRIAVGVAALIFVLASALVWVGSKNLRIRAELGRLNQAVTRIDTQPRTQDVSRILRDLEAIRKLLENPVLRGGKLNPQQAQLRKSFLRRSAQYLDGLYATAGQNPDLAKEVAAIYVQIAGLQLSEAQPELADRAGAVESYGSAARQLAQAAGKEPGNQEIRARLAEIEGRLSRLEARLPAEAILILHPAPLLARSAVLTPVPNPVPRVFKGPGPLGGVADRNAGPAPSESPGRPAASNVSGDHDATELMFQVQSKVAAAEEYYLRLKSELEGQGYSVRPRITEYFNTMNLRLASAQRQLDRGDYAAAMESLKIVREYAARLIDNR
jgi:hypothetical protein